MDHHLPGDSDWQTSFLRVPSGVQPVSQLPAASSHGQSTRQSLPAAEPPLARRSPTGRTTPTFSFRKWHRLLPRKSTSAWERSTASIVFWDRLATSTPAPCSPPQLSNLIAARDGIWPE